MNKQRKEKGLLIPYLQDGEYFFNKGIESYRGKNIHKAQRYLERAIQLQPQYPLYLCQLAIILADQGEYSRSNECLNKIVQNNLIDDMHECHYFLANNYANLGLFEHARKEALLYLEKDIDGEFLEEVEDLLELIQVDDDLFAEEEVTLIRYELALQELREGNYHLAITHFTDLIKDEPTYWMAYTRLAEAHYENGDRSTAMTILREVLTKEDQVTARCYLMTYLYETGSKEEANELLQSLMNVMPIDHEQCYILATSFGKVGHHTQAYELLDRLQRLGYGDYPTFYYHLAVAAFYTNRIEKAVGIWEKLAILGNESAMENLDLYYQGELTKPAYFSLS